MARDILEAVVNLLRADDDLIVKVDARIYGDELPPGAVEGMPKGTVIVRRAAGIGGVGGYVELEEGAIELFCYGVTPYDAEQVRLLAYKALKHMRRKVVQETMLHSFDMMSGPQALRDGDTQWPYNVSIWRFLASEVQAT